MWLSLLRRRQDKHLGPNDRDTLDALIMKKQGLQTVKVEKALYQATCHKMGGFFITTTHFS